jgi:hypothetical protein
LLGLPPFVSFARIDGGDSSRSLLEAPPLGIGVAASGVNRWLVRGADPVVFADFCAELRRGQARVYVDPQRY